MRKIELLCSCGNVFLRSAAEHKRSQKIGRKAYCSRHCYGVANRVNLPLPTPGSASHLDPANRHDDFSQFRWHFRNICQRDYEVTVTLEDLKDQWELQGGVCPYTGWQLKNMRTTRFTDQLPLTPDRASLDRIDSTKGYVKGNIQFVSVMAQYAKNIFSEQELLNFCKQVVIHEQAKILSGSGCCPGTRSHGNRQPG